MKNITTIILFMAAASAIFLAGRGCRGWRKGGGYCRAQMRTDTIVVRDTLRDTVLVPVERLVVRVDTLYLHAPGDTVRIRVAAPIERKVYATADYRAVVEGFRPVLTEMELYPATTRITTLPGGAIERRPPGGSSARWGIGVQAGWGLTPKGAAPYVGVGVQYNFVTW
jgi:hypothetical protein